MADSLNDLLIQIQELMDKVERISFGSETETVTHNDVTRSSVAKSIKDKYDAIQALVQGALVFETKVLMDAGGAPPSGELAKVWNDPVVENNGLYGYSGGWIKSKYDPEASAQVLVSELMTTISSWADVDVIVNDPFGDFKDGVIGSGAIVSAPATWPFSGNVIELTTTGVMDSAESILRNESGGKYKLSDYAGKKLDVVIAAELGALSHTGDNSDFNNFGILLQSGSTWPQIEAYYYRKINDTVSEFRATIDVDSFLSAHPDAEIQSVKMRFWNGKTGTVRWGAIRLAVSTVFDAAVFDSAYAALPLNKSLYSEISALQKLPFNQPVILVNDIAGGRLNEIAVNSVGSGSVVSPVGWPSEIGSVYSATVLNDGASASIDLSIRDENSAKYQLSDYSGKFISATFCIESDLDLNSDFYRCGFLFNSDQGYFDLDVALDRSVNSVVDQYHAVGDIDEMMAGRTNCELMSVSIQAKPDASGYLRIGAIRAAIGSSPSKSYFFSAYSDTGSAEVLARLVGVESESAKASSDVALVLASSGANQHKTALSRGLSLASAGMPLVDSGLASVVVGGDATLISSPKSVSKDSSVLRWLHGQLVSPAGAAYPRDRANSVKSVTQATTSDPVYDYSANAMGVEFDFYGDAVDVGIGKQVSPNPIFVEIDGVLVSSSGILPTVGTNGEHMLSLSFSSRKRRTIRLTSLGGLLVFGLYHEPLGIVFKSQPGVESTGVIVGDSITEGSVAAGVYEKFGYRLGRHLGIHNFVVSGLGGTGYLQKIPHHNGGDRFNLLERIEDVYNPFGNGVAPDCVVFCMGINDGSLVVVDVATNARLCYEAVRTQLPNTPIFVVGPFNTVESNYNSVLASAIKTEVDKIADAYWIDNSDWITGTGKATALIGDGIADWVRSDDNTHPTNEGHDYYAERIAGAMTEIIRGF